jgi:hypothetical protein
MTERAELLGVTSGVVRQYPAGPERIFSSPATYPIKDGRRRWQARHVVMLGEPIAAIAQPLGMAGKVARIAQRIGRGSTEQDRR